MLKEDKAGLAPEPKPNLAHTFLASPAGNLLAGVFRCFWRSRSFAKLWGWEGKILKFKAVSAANGISQLLMQLDQRRSKLKYFLKFF